MISAEAEMLSEIAWRCKGMEDHLERLALAMELMFINTPPRSRMILDVQDRIWLEHHKKEEVEE